MILTPGTASPYAPKAFRASAGSALRVPVVRNVLSTDAVRWVRSTGALLAGADAHGGEEPGALAGVAELDDGQQQALAISRRTAAGQIQQFIGLGGHTHSGVPGDRFESARSE